MSKPITDMPKKLQGEVWDLAMRIEWTTEDWKDFYCSLTAFFTRLVGRHAKTKIKELTDKEPQA